MRLCNNYIELNTHIEDLFDQLEHPHRRFIWST